MTPIFEQIANSPLKPPKSITQMRRFRRRLDRHGVTLLSVQFDRHAGAIAHANGRIARIEDDGRVSQWDGDPQFQGGQENRGHAQLLAASGVLRRKGRLGDARCLLGHCAALRV
jgi:hypothetical protein